MKLALGLPIGDNPTAYYTTQAFTCSPGGHVTSITTFTTMNPQPMHGSLVRAFSLVCSSGEVINVLPPTVAGCSSFSLDPSLAGQTSTNAAGFPLSTIFGVALTGNASPGSNKLSVVAQQVCLSNSSCYVLLLTPHARTPTCAYAQGDDS